MDEKKKNRSYYQGAWKNIESELAEKLHKNCFTPKGDNGKYEIGNAHGEVYAYPASGTLLAEKLSYILIYPSHKGNLLVKIVFPHRKGAIRMNEHLKLELNGTSFGGIGKKEDSGFVCEYYFFEKTRPDNPHDLGAELIETADKWLSSITRGAA